MKSVQLMIKIFINMLGNDEENVLCGIPGITHYCSPIWLCCACSCTLGQRTQLCWGQESLCSFWLHRLAAAEG